MTDLKNGRITVIVPCRNESRYIGKVLETIAAQDIPRERLEVFVVDGRSDDDTRKIVEQFSSRHPFVQLLDNPDKVVPHALNLAIRRSTGDVIVRMDAHAVYPVNYISTLVAALETYQADNTGGVWITEAGASTKMANAIARASSHPFGIGNARYRLGAQAPVETDTVPYGCYRRSVFDRIGYFDADLVRNQDDEFNARLLKSGGKIMLLPEVRIHYFARPTLGKLALMFYQYGLFKPLVNAKLGKPATLRQLFPPAFVAALFLLPLVGIFFAPGWSLWFIMTGLYLILDLLVSMRLSLNKQAVLFPFLLLVFPVIHISYGLGYWKGIVRFLIFRKYSRSREYGISR